MQQQQQHSADYDLLAVFSDEAKAGEAEQKLRKAGFGEDEIYRLSAGSIRGGEFREHGPRRDRSAFFLRTTRSGPSPLQLALLAVVAAVVLGIVAFGVGFAFPASEHGFIVLLGVVLGLIAGLLFGVIRGGRVRGAIGQDLSKVPSTAAASSRQARTIVALRLPDPEDIRRKSRARAILLNAGGRLDRSVGRQE